MSPIVQEEGRLSCGRIHGIVHRKLRHVSPAGPRRRDYLAPPAVPRLSHFPGDTVQNLEYAQNLQASLQSIQRAMEHTQITGREANAKSYAK